jgi:ribonuclease HI
MLYYAVAKGHQIGLFNTWDECKQHTHGYKGAIYKKFACKEDAEKFILDNSPKTEDMDCVESVSNVVFDADYYVYTDGACSNNGRENASAGIGIYFGENDARNVSQRIIGKQSNNTAELSAIIHLYDIIENDIKSGKKVCIVTDSEYAIKCCTTYGKKCAADNWKKSIPNKDMVMKLFEMYTDKPNIKILHVSAHTKNTDIHSIGNAGADKLANQSIGLCECPYTRLIH